MSIDPTALFDLSYGLYLITAETEDEISGCVINTALQLTNEPLTVMVAVNKENYTNRIIQESGRFTVTTLSENTDIDFIQNFGFRSSKSFNKFDAYPVSKTEMDTPFVNHMAVSGFVCDVIDSLDVFTHTIFVGKLISSKKLSHDKPLTYRYYHEVLKGKTPKKASSYVPSKEELEKSEKETSSSVAVDQDTSRQESSSVNRFECQVCGYIAEYEGEELPEDFVCPVCGATRNQFVKL